MSRILMALLLGLFVNATSMANEAPAKEEPKAEGEAKEGEAAGPASGGSPEYMKKEGELRTAEARVKESREKMKDMILKKQTITDAKQKGQIVEELKTIHLEFLKNTKEYNTKKDDLRYRYPDKGKLIESRFMPLKEKPIEEIERETGLDADLTRVKKTFDQKYKVFKAPHDEQVVAKKPKKTSSDPEKPKKLQLVK